MIKPGTNHLKKELFPRDHHHLPVFLSLIAVMLGLIVAVFSVKDFNNVSDTNANKDQCIPLPNCYYNGTCSKTIYNATMSGQIGHSSNHWCAPNPSGVPGSGVPNQTNGGGVTCGNLVCQPGQQCKVTECTVPLSTPCPTGSEVCPTPAPSQACEPTFSCVGSVLTPTPSLSFLPCNDRWPDGTFRNQGYCPSGLQCNNKTQTGAPFGICVPSGVTVVPTGNTGQINTPTPSNTKATNAARTQ